jgi:hypothetical protein
LQRRGIPALIFYTLLNNLIENGVKYCETGPSLETNTAMLSLWKNFDKKQKTKKSKKTRHGAKKKIKVKDMFTDEDMLYDAIAENKVVNFYPDVDNPDYMETFYNLHDFDNYVAEQGIEISDDEVRNIMNRDISHCTVQNINGKPQLVSDSSYGGLYWTCNPENVYSMYN